MSANARDGVGRTHRDNGNRVTTSGSVAFARQRAEPLEQSKQTALRQFCGNLATGDALDQRPPVGSTTSHGPAGSALFGRSREGRTLDLMLETVRASESRVLVLRGERGIGKSALLEYLVRGAWGCRVARAAGVESEMELAYAGLHQLCAPVLDLRERLPTPQRDALAAAFGLSAEPAPDPFFIGLAALGLLSEVAAERPLVCVVDDAQWLDKPSALALAFVARRLPAEAIGLVIAVREPCEGREFAGLPKLMVGGLGEGDARALLEAALPGRLDERVRERVVSESRGNPRALLELPRGLPPAHLAGGFAVPDVTPLVNGIEQSAIRRLELLPVKARRLLLIAAAEPLGDVSLLWRAAAPLGLDADAAAPAQAAGLIDIGALVRFRHPLLRSAIYCRASLPDRRAAHSALAEATDSKLDPDRKAWHRAQATTAPDEDVATELERTAVRAKLRGGLAAAGAFLERAAMLTVDAGKRATRALAAADVMYEAGAFDAVENLLLAVESAKLDEIHLAHVERLHAQVCLAVADTDTDGTLRLLAAAERLGRVDPARAHSAHLEAMRAALHLANPELLQAVATALAESPASEKGAIEEVVVRGWALMLIHGPPAGANLLREAAIALREKPQLDESDLPLFSYIDAVTRSLWDYDTWESLTRRTLQLARDCGALSTLPRVLAHWAEVKGAAGEFAEATSALAEAEAIAEAAGTSPDKNRNSAWLDAWRFEEAEALRRIELHERKALAVHPGLDCARSLVYNAAGRYESALAAAQRSCDADPLGIFNWSLIELIESAARCGQHERANAALGCLVDRTRLTSTEWSLGLVARSTALQNDDPTVAEPLYREAVERLSRARTRPDQARAHLLYGEWLRRQNRRLDAREQLRMAYDMFIDIGAPGFAERARRELSATGEFARKRTDDTRADLTAQEAQIARLAAEGQTNPEIGAQLFLSPRTVEWHLRKIFAKLNISSRRQLRAALSERTRSVAND